jgi:hypothetical protein
MFDVEPRAGAVGIKEMQQFWFRVLLGNESCVVFDYFVGKHHLVIGGHRRRQEVLSTLIPEYSHNGSKNAKEHENGSYSLQVHFVDA